jgi:hypothetical protein
MADAMKPLWQDVEQEAPDALVGIGTDSGNFGSEMLPSLKCALVSMS